MESVDVADNVLLELDSVFSSRSPDALEMSHPKDTVSTKEDDVIPCSFILYDDDDDD